jgi:rod shape-determining protein MreB
MHQGIIITGGSALMMGLDELLTRELKIQVALADDPLTAVVRGTGIVLEDIERYQDLLISNKDDLPSR